MARGKRTGGAHADGVYYRFNDGSSTSLQGKGGRHAGGCLSHLLMFSLYVLALVALSAAQCNPEHGGHIGYHDGACKPIGATQVRVDHTTWRCEKGDPGDYPYGTWVRVS